MSFRSFAAMASLAATALLGLAGRLSESAREFRRLSYGAHHLLEEIPGGRRGLLYVDDCLPTGVIWAGAQSSDTPAPPRAVRLRIGAYRCRGLFGRKHDWRMRRSRPMFRSGPRNLPSSGAGAK